VHAWQPITTFFVRQQSMNVALRMLTSVVFVVALAASPAWGQQAQTVRLRGTIERVEGSAILVKAAEVGDVTVQLSDKVAVFGVVKATLADVKPGAFIGVGAMPQPDGSQKAIQVTIFAESQRGTGEGHRPWDRPGATMTNATVDTTVTSVDGQVVTVKYKDGEQKILIPPDATMRAYVVGSRDELKPGAHIAIVRALKKPDGTYEADRVNVGRDGIVP
jgi:hypothetical protein